jgi:hypothetical protein
MVLLMHCVVLEAICNASESLYKSRFLNKLAEYYYLRVIKNRYSKNVIEYNNILEQIRERGNLYNLRNPLDRIKAREDQILNDLFVKRKNFLKKEKKMFQPFNTIIKWNAKLKNFCANVNMSARKNIGFYYSL